MAEKGVFCVLFCYIYQGFVSEFPVSGFGLRIFGVSDAWEKLGKRKKKTLATVAHTLTHIHTRTQRKQKSLVITIYSPIPIQVPFTTSICSQLYPRLSMPIAPPPLWWPWHLRPLATATRSVETHIPAASTTRR